MIEPNQLTRPRWCPHCLSRMRVSPNPYYGVGLAVHQHLAGCPRCGFVEFLPRVARPVDAPAEAAPPPPPSFLQRVRALLAWLLAAAR